jgi:hypothetical protein
LTATTKRCSRSRDVAAGAPALLVAALAVAVARHRLLPAILVWLLVAVLVWAAVTVWYRTLDRKRGAMPPDRHLTDAHPHRATRPLRPGETFAPAVRLRLAPNVPLAEAICVRLRAAGIEAFWKHAQGPAAAFSGGTSDFGPAEIWVRADRVADASALLGTD